METFILVIVMKNGNKFSVQDVVNIQGWNNLNTAMLKVRTTTGEIFFNLSEIHFYCRQELEANVEIRR